MANSLHINRTRAKAFLVLTYSTVFSPRLRFIGRLCGPALSHRVQTRRCSSVKLTFERHWRSMRWTKPSGTFTLDRFAVILFGRTVRYPSRATLSSRIKLASSNTTTSATSIKHRRWTGSYTPASRARREKGCAKRTLLTVAVIYRESLISSLLLWLRRSCNDRIITSENTFERYMQGRPTSAQNFPRYSARRNRNGR